MEKESGRTIPRELEDMFTAHHRRVYRAAYRLLGNQQDAEDVLQTVFMRLVRREPDAAEMKSVESYLHRAAVNAALDILRSRKETVELSTEDDGPVSRLAIAFSADRDLDLDLKRWLRQAIGKLNQRSAEMFVLRYIEDLNNREIAAIFKTTQATVAVTLFRTRAVLQKDFKQYMRGTR